MKELSLLPIWQAATEYLDIGWSIFPLGWRKKVDGMSEKQLRFTEKRPLVKWGQYQKRLMTKAELTRFAQAWPDANIGVATGELSGIIVLDIDTAKAQAAVAGMCDANKLPDTVVQKTGRPGGLQLFFKWMSEPDGTRYRGNEISAVIPNTDTRVNGGYAVLAPSSYPNSKNHENARPAYEWLVDPRIEEPAHLPEELYPLFFEEIQTDQFVLTSEKPPKLPSAKKLKNKHSTWVDEALLGVDQGSRNDTCARLAGHMITATEYSIQKLTDLIQSLSAWNVRNRPPMDSKELETTAASIWTKHQKELAKQEEQGQQEVHSINANHAVIRVGGHVRVLREFQNELGWPDVVTMPKTDFFDMYANRLIKIGRRTYNPAQLWFSSENRREYLDGFTFKYPDKVQPGRYNLWHGFHIRPQPGNWARFRYHIEEVVCQNNEYIYGWLYTWLARLFQRPLDGPIGSAIVLTGGKGVGKNTFADVIVDIFGPHGFTATDPELYVGTFNWHLKNCVVLFCNESVFAPDKKAAKKIQAMITDTKKYAHQKFETPIMIDNHMNLIIATNESFAAPASIDERRYFVLDVSSKHQGDQAYWTALHDELNKGGKAAFLYDMLRLEIDTDEYNLRKPPDTAGLVEQKLYNLDSVQAFWIEILATGVIREQVEIEGKRETVETKYPSTITCSELHDSYLFFCRRSREHYPLKLIPFSKRIRQVCPEIKAARSHEERLLVFPGIKSARALATSQIGHEFE